MTTDRDYLDYFEDIAVAAEKIAQFVQGMTYEQFARDDKTAYAVVRALEIIGEAAKKIPSPVKEEHSAIPWRGMMGIRDKLIHDYFGVNLEVVWKTAWEDVPSLATQVRCVLREKAKKS